MNEFQARFNATIDIGSVPLCFNQCISDIETPGLSPDEKNCMRECYFKRVTAKDDMNTLFQQKLALEELKSMRQRLV